MTDQQVVQYITTQKQAGYSDAQIKQALLASGYQTTIIDEAFSSLAPKSAAHQEAEQYAKQGMSAVQTYTQLQQQGYDSKLARKAVKETFGASVPGDHHPARIVFALLTIIVTIGGAYVITGLQNDDNTLPPGTGQSTYTSVAEQLDTVMRIARDSGKESAIKECELRFRNDDRDLCYLDVTLAIIDKAPDDSICDKIVDVKMRDVCLMNFLETDRFDSVCSRVQLSDNKETCNRLKAYSANNAVAT